MKCNFDASFLEHQRNVGIGICLRDEHDMFMGAKTMWLQPLVDVKVGEALVLLEALEWRRELCFHNLFSKK